MIIKLQCAVLYLVSRLFDDPDRVVDVSRLLAVDGHDLVVLADAASGSLTCKANTESVLKCAKRMCASVYL